MPGQHPLHHLSLRLPAAHDKHHLRRLAGRRPPPVIQLVIDILERKPRSPAREQPDQAPENGSPCPHKAPHHPKQHKERPQSRRQIEHAQPVGLVDGIHQLPLLARHIHRNGADLPLGSHLRRHCESGTLVLFL